MLSSHKYYLQINKDTKMIHFININFFESRVTQYFMAKIKRRYYFTTSEICTTTMLVLFIEDGHEFEILTGL
jgi:hypothetical protein